MCGNLTDKNFLHGARLTERLMNAYALTKEPCLCENCQEAVQNMTTQTAIGKTGVAYVGYDDSFGRGHVLNDANMLSEWDDDDMAIFESEEEATEAVDAFNEMTGKNLKVGSIDIDANSFELLDWQPKVYAECTGFGVIIKQRKKFEEASKRRFIQQVEGLTPEEVDTITQFIDARPNIQVDWNHLPDAQFFRDLVANYKSKSQKKKDAKKNPFDYFKDIPGCHLLVNNDKWQMILIQSWEAGKVADTFAPGGQGAKWCIGWKNSDTYWNNYTSQGDLFVVAISKDPEKTDIDLLNTTRNKRPITAGEAISRFHGNFDDGWDEQEAGMSDEERRKVVGYHGLGKKYMLQIPTKRSRVKDTAKAWHWYDEPDDCIYANKWKSAFGVTYGELLDLCSKHVETLNTETYECAYTGPKSLKIPATHIGLYNVVLAANEIESLNIGAIMSALNNPRIDRISITCPEDTSVHIGKLMFGFTPCKKPVQFDLPNSRIDMVDIANLDGRMTFMFSSPCHADKVRVKRRLNRVCEDFLNAVLVGDFTYGTIEEVANDW